MTTGKLPRNPRPLSSFLAQPSQRQLAGVSLRGSVAAAIRLEVSLCSTSLPPHRLRNLQRSLHRPDDGLRPQSLDTLRARSSWALPYHVPSTACAPAHPLFSPSIAIFITSGAISGTAATNSVAHASAMPSPRPILHRVLSGARDPADIYTSTMNKAQRAGDRYGSESSREPVRGLWQVCS